MHRPIATVLAVALLGVATPATAKWHPFRWGMTKADVKRANGASLAPGDPTSSYLIGGPRNAVQSEDVLEGKVPMIASGFHGLFGFDAKGGLMGVMVTSESQVQCMLALSQLTNAYGGSEVDSVLTDADNSAWRWIRPADGDDVSFVVDRRKGSCSLFVMPIKPAG